MSKATEKLAHHSVEELRQVCALLNVERSGEKKALSERIAKFLAKPTDLGESKPPLTRTPSKRGKASPKGSKAKVAKTAAGSGKSDTEESASDEEGDAKVIADLEQADA